MLRVCIVAALSALLPSGVSAQVSYAPYVPSVKPTWVLIVPSFAGTSPSVAPLLFNSEADCKVVAAQFSPVGRCIAANVVR